MENYAEVVGFDYTSENEWRRWIEERFLHLHKQLFIIQKIRNYLKDVLKENFKEAFNREPVKEILLGGITKDGEYAQNSLAKLYKDALGIFINPKEWVTYCKDPFQNPEDYIQCKFETTTFLMFVTEIKELVEKILSKMEIEPQNVEDKEIEEIIESPEKILGIIKEIYESVVSVSANYDYHMFFILNTRCIPRFFIEKAYPKLKENFEKVAEILELEEKFVPNINDEKVKKDYTLIGHKENGFADTLYRLNIKLWEWFRIGSYGENTIGQIFKVVIKNVADLEDEYFEKCRKMISENEYSKRGIRAFYFTKNDDIYLEMYSGNSSNFRNEGSTTLMKLFNEVSPELFLGVKSLIIKSLPDFKYEINEVGYVRCIYLRD